MRNLVSTTLLLCLGASQVHAQGGGIFEAPEQPSAKFGEATRSFSESGDLSGASPGERGSDRREASLPLEGTIDPASYMVGPGDRLLVEIYGVQQMSSDVEVNAEGRLFIPRIGVVQAGGLSLDAVRKALEQRIHAVYPNLRGNVTLARPRTFLVHITGAVLRPGTYTATPLTRVSALIPRAGGTLANGSSRRVELRRKNGRVAYADLVRFALFGESGGDPTVLDGDTLFVPLRQVAAEINGGVKRPGRYELLGRKDLHELMELAGGPSTMASRDQRCRLTTRGRGDKLEVRTVDCSAAAELHDGDAVHVPEIADLRRLVIVEGAVVGSPATAQQLQQTPSGERADATPAAAQREVSVPVPFVAGDGVRDLVSKVHGLEPWADGSNAYLLRPHKGAARQRINVDIQAIVTGAAPDVEIEAGDTLVVPSRRDSVLVGGAVQKPGMYQYSPELHPADYVNLAGGATRTGSASGARVLHRNGESQRIDKVGAVEPGDVITVPEKSVTTAEWVTIVLILGNIAVGTAALVVSARR